MKRRLRGLMVWPRYRSANTNEVLMNRIVRRLQVVAIACVTMLLGTALPAAASSKSGESAELDLKPLFVVQSSTQTFSDAVIELAAKSEEYRLLAESWVTIWEQQGSLSTEAAPTLQAGTLGVESTALNSAIERTVTASELHSLRESLSALGSSDTTNSSSASNTETAAELPGVTPYFVDPNSPTSWPVSGTRGSGNTYWKDMLLIVEGRFCASSCTITDRITVRFTINPGPVKNMISGTKVYSPNAGNFWAPVEVMFKTLNDSGVTTGTGTSYLSGSSNSWTHGNGTEYYGKYLRIAAAIGVTIYPFPFNGNVYWEGAKTNCALCNSQADPWCFFLA